LSIDSLKGLTAADPKKRLVKAGAEAQAQEIVEALGRRHYVQTLARAIVYSAANHSTHLDAENRLPLIAFAPRARAKEKAFTRRFLGSAAVNPFRESIDNRMGSVPLKWEGSDPKAGHLLSTVRSHLGRREPSGPCQLCCATSKRRRAAFEALTFRDCPVRQRFDRDEKGRRPSFVSSYSTRGGTLGNNGPGAETAPLVAGALQGDRVVVSIFCEMPSIALCSLLNAWRAAQQTDD